MLDTIKTNAVVNQNVLKEVGSSFFIFFKSATKLRQKIIDKIGVKYKLIKKKNDIDIPLTKYVITLVTYPTFQITH